MIHPDNMSMNLVVALGVDRTLTMQQTIAFSDQFHFRSLVQEFLNAP